VAQQQETLKVKSMSWRMQAIPQREIGLRGIINQQ
jgi:hypothetical protein